MFEWDVGGIANGSLLCTRFALFVLRAIANVRCEACGVDFGLWCCNSFGGHWSIIPPSSAAFFWGAYTFEGLRVSGSGCWGIGVLGVLGVPRVLGVPWGSLRCLGCLGSLGFLRSLGSLAVLGVVGVLGGPWGLWKSLEVFRGLGILVVICIFHQGPFYAFLVFASLCFCVLGPLNQGPWFVVLVCISLSICPKGPLMSLGSGVRLYKRRIRRKAAPRWKLSWTGRFLELITRNHSLL